MKLYLISQSENTGYDTYDSAIVAAPDEETARQISPDQYCDWADAYSGWCSSPDKVTVTYLGKAKPNTQSGIILSSFNAG